MKKLSTYLFCLIILSLPLVAQTQTQYKVSPKVREHMNTYADLYAKLPNRYSSYDTAIVYLYEKMNTQALLAMKNVNSDIDFLAVMDKCGIHTWSKMSDGSIYSKKLTETINKIKQQDKEYAKLIVENKYYVKGMDFLNSQILKIGMEYNTEGEYFETVVHLKQKLSSYTPIEQHWILGTFSEWFDHIKVTDSDMAATRLKMKATGFEPIVEMADY
ncbi:MAG TPA: hypothetical protein PK886_00135 [Candidatus Paceibacterota bacterium]|nr:hypothetical protein [Candidatus Paceibacterota bacterium]